MEFVANGRRVFLGFFLLSQLCTVIWAQTYRFKIFGVVDGLRNLSVLSIGQDRTGYIWIGTLNGVYRYDGVQFQQFGIAQGLPGSKVVSLAAASDGSFWAGTDGGLAQWSGGKWIAVDFGKPIALAGQGSLAPDARRNVLWVATQQGVGFVPLSGNRRGPPRGEIVFQPDTEIRSVGLDTGNSLWCGGQGVLYRSRQSASHPITTGFTRALDQFPQDSWESILSDSTGKLWIRSSLHLLSWENTTGKFKQTAALPNSIFGGLGFLPDGVLAVPTSFGLARYQGEHWTLLNARNGLPVDSVSSVFVDREGSPWIGTNGGGVARWQGYGSWEAWNAPFFLENDSVWSIVEDSHGGLWFGTDRGVGHLDRGRKNANGPLRTAIPTQSPPIALAIDASDSLWIATAHHGLLHCQSETLACDRVGAANGLPAQDLTGLVRDRAGVIWAATTKGLFVNTGSPSRARFRLEPLPGSSSQTRVRSLAIDRSGQVLISGDGLWIGNLGHWSKFTARDGLLSEEVDQVEATAHGSIWISYSRRIGISHLELQPDHPPRWTHYSTQNGLSSNFIYFLGADAQGRLWAGTDVGLDVLTGNPPAGAKWKHYSTENGLIWQDFNTRAFFLDRQGGLWFGTSHGLAHFLNRELLAKAVPPVAVIRETEIGGQPQVLSDTIQTPSGRGDVTLKYSALSFLDESTTSFRYRIRGLQEEWRETDETNVHFPDLQPGHYTFELIARTGAGLTSITPALLPIYVPAPWWRTQSFRITLVLCSLGAFLLLWNWRTRALVARQRQLEAAVMDRTRDLLVEQQNLLRAREAYAYQANHDALTGLYNRAFLHHELSHQILLGRKIAVIWLDLDQFKGINDVFGHDAGDAVLQEVAQRLREIVGENAVIARLGGDEFVILIFDVNRATACSSASRIVDILADPCRVGSQTHCVTASVGVSMHPEHGNEAGLLLRNADLAMYKAKKKGKNGFMYFDHLDHKQGTPADHNGTATLVSSPQ